MGSNDTNLTSEKKALSEFFSLLLTENEVHPPKQFDDKKKLVTDDAAYLPDIPNEIHITNKIKANTIEQEFAHDELPSKVIKSQVRDEAFQVMMFKTAGLTLAIPLVELSGVIFWPDNITVMPGHKESYLGLAQHQDKKIPIIDIAQIVFPQDRAKTWVDFNNNDRLKRIVFINNFEWGLACDAVNEVITIEPSQIKWRKSNTKRAWLAGTVVEYMCALLDTIELSKLLNSDHS
ncbi:hypothetical protein MNBD_GAMMA22-569 [hydrothermal vent metagenome]|uniref:CheW-like domain-containing protein n=1 Tax=hydrothermal vent metagenome TaxID=652676 RepID=A0A3B1AGG6_9ZZZZ